MDCDCDDKQKCHGGESKNAVFFSDRTTCIPETTLTSQMPKYCPVSPPECSRYQERNDPEKHDARNCGDADECVIAETSSNAEMSSCEHNEASSDGRIDPSCC